jgi:hypothetical protein
MRPSPLLATLALTTAALALSACDGDTEKTADTSVAETTTANTDTDTDTDGGDDDGTDGTTETETGAIELSPELCDDPRNLERVIAALGDGGDGGGEALGGMNEDALPKLLENPTEPFYMVNLIRFRDQAEYADGRETDLTGREANALYDPLPYIESIGGRVVYISAVSEQIDGADDVLWQDIAIVEYSCPIAFLAMITHPDFQETSIHKDAGVEKTRVMFTSLRATAAPSDPDQSEATYPPTEEDPAFDLMHVMDFHDIAQYEEGVDEPERTGAEAWAEYQAAGSGASVSLGHYTTAMFSVTGTLIGETTGWDEIVLVRMSSMAGFEALLEDEARSEGRYHRIAALADNDSMVLFPGLSNIPYSDDSADAPLEVTPNGTGTICEDVSDCPTDFICLTDGSGPGFCTPSTCSSGTCEGSYVCCHDCNPGFEDALPFEESACLPDAAAPTLEAEPVSCTCD